MTDRNPIPWQLSHLEQLSQRSVLPKWPSERAVKAATIAYYYRPRTMITALIAAYAIDSACSDHPLTDQEAAEAANLETLSGYNT